MSSIQFFIADGQLTKPVEQGMAGFHYPAARFKRWIQSFLPLFFSPRPNVRFISRSKHHPQLFISNVSCIGAEFFFFMRHDRRYSFALENRPKLGGVMPVRPGHDDGQRDATPVHKNMALASFFFPDPWGSPRNSQALAALYSYCHLLIATPRQCTESRSVHSGLSLPGIGVNMTLSVPVKRSILTFSLGDFPHEGLPWGAKKIKGLRVKS